MSDVDYAVRLDAFKAWVLSDYEPSNVGLYNSIVWENSIVLDGCIIRINKHTSAPYSPTYPGLSISSIDANTGDPLNIAQDFTVTKILEEVVGNPTPALLDISGLNMTIGIGTSVSNIIDTSSISGWIPSSSTYVTIDSYTTDPLGDLYEYSF